LRRFDKSDPVSFPLPTIEENRKGFSLRAVSQKKEDYRGVHNRRRMKVRIHGEIDRK